MIESEATLSEKLQWEVDDLKYRLELCERKHDPITEDTPMTLAKMRRVIEQNKRYREALEFYAESEKHIDPYAYGEFGEKARQALEQER